MQMHAIICFNHVVLFLCSASLLVATGASIAPKQPKDTTKDTLAYIAFVNDVHNRLEEEEPLTATPCQPSSKAQGRCVGGWPRIATEVKALRQQAAREGAAFWFLDAGDEFTGSLWDVVYKGAVTPLLQKAVGQDAMTLGNHEFDFGVTVLGSYIRNLSEAIPMLGGCNVDTSQEPALRGLLKKWLVLTHKTPKKNFKVGVLSWLTPDTAATAPSIGKVKMLPVIPSVKQCLAELKAQHKDLEYVIGLSHTGYTSDLETAAAVPGLDVIIGGHSHTFLYTPTGAGPIVTCKPGVNASNCLSLSACDKPAGPYPTYVKDTPVVQAYYSSKYLGLIKINLSQRKLLPGVQPLLLGGANSSRNVQQDPGILNLLAKFSGPVETLKTTVTGRALVPLEGAFAVTRSNETNLGDYVCDSFLRAVPSSVTAKTGKINICLMVAGGIRLGVNPGNITVADVLSMLPYANALSIFSISGQVLIDAVKHGASGFPNSGRFLQVSGIRYYHNNGAFLSAVFLNPDGSTSPINPAKSYTIVATDYMLQGGDGYQFTGANVILPAGEPYAELVMADMKQHPEGIAPTTDNRIINCAVYSAFPGCATAIQASKQSTTAPRTPVHSSSTQSRFQGTNETLRQRSKHTL